MLTDGRSRPDQGVDDPPGLARSLTALNVANFFMADLQSGLGPFLGVYLINRPGWNSAGVGLELTVAPAMALLFQTPAGALIDVTHRKRALLAAAAVLTSTGTLLVAIAPSVAVVTIAQVLTGLGQVLLPAVIAAIALGMVGPEGYTYRTGRLAAFNHAGNVIGAVVVGVVGFTVGLRTSFWLAGSVGVVVLVAAFTIRPRLIDHDVARGLQPRRGRDRPSAFGVLFRNRPLLMLAGATGLW